MSTAETVANPSIQVAGDLRRQDLGAALAAGWADFRAKPLYGLFFALFYALGGVAVYLATVAQGQTVWFVTLAAGFPILAPFAAVGIYEVSRRREAGQPVSWGDVLGALRGQGTGQLPMMAVAVLIVFGFWVILARGIFAIFLGESGIGDETLGVLLSLQGIAMLVVGTAIGGFIAAVLFSITVVSLPMLLDRDMDFVTAIIASLETVRRNRGVMMLWAILIAVVLAISMLPFFAGLLITLPILGHASWHLYRRAVPA